MFLEQVSAIIREVALAEVVPRFRALTAVDIIEKTPGDLVTVADRECERVLAERLRAVRELPVVGEEATAADPSLLDLVATAPAAWIIDPIDGTTNFVAGDPRFAVMVALVEHGVSRAAWVWHPETDSMLAAERGADITRNGIAVAPAERSGEACGIIKRKYMGEPARSRLAEFPATVGRLVRARQSAGIEYSALIAGEIDFLVYWRTLPWDHAPGGLLAEAAGLRVARPDGTPYCPGDGRLGLIAATPEVWDRVADVIETALAT